jgi:hypothetical protein
MQLRLIGSERYRIPLLFTDFRAIIVFLFRLREPLALFIACDDDGSIIEYSRTDAKQLKEANPSQSDGGGPFISNLSAKVKMALTIM